MNFDTELRDIDLKKYTPVDCSAFVLFPRGKIKNLYFKSTNKIRGSYFDSVLKENIYLSSNNLKKNAYLKKVELDTNFLQLDKNFFTTYFKKIEDNLASAFNTKVKLVQTKKGSGSITFDYYSTEELSGLLEKLNINVS